MIFNLPRYRNNISRIAFWRFGNCESAFREHGATVAHGADRWQNDYTAQTTAVGFGSPIVSRRTHRPSLMAVFLRPYYALVRLLWAGYGGEGSRPAGFLERRSSNPAVCPPAPIGSGARVYSPVLGGHCMAHSSIPARSEQTHPPEFNLAARAARRAVRQWFAGWPIHSLAEWRDTCRAEHCDGLPLSAERGKAFDDAFCREIGCVIVSGGLRNA